MNDNILTLPCPHMLFNKDHYHECKLLPGHGSSSGSCLCAWFYDLVSDLFYKEETITINDKPCTISRCNFPDIPHGIDAMLAAKKANIPNNCPMHFTYEAIDRRMKALDPDFFIDRVRPL